KLLKLSDEGGRLNITLMSEGSFHKDMLKSDEVFIADTGKEVFVWIGKTASKNEKKNGLAYAHNYLNKTKHPFIPVSVLKEGQESDSFENIFD
ncbi:gelsolin/scinderin family protein, partial [Salmonella sp. s54412]